MPLSLSSLRYTLTSFRTSTPYLLYQILQLILSILIITIAFLSDDLFRQTIVLWLQFILLFSMCFDLFVIRLCTQGGLWKRSNNKWKRNVFDTVVVVVFVVTFVILCATENKYEEGEQSQYSVIVETDDIILIAVIIVRYAIQIYQILKTIRNTTKNISYNKKMKDIDLNKTPNSSIIEQKNDAMQDQILRKKLQQRNQYRKQNSENKQQPNNNMNANMNVNVNQEIQYQLAMK